MSADIERLKSAAEDAESDRRRPKKVGRPYRIPAGLIDSLLESFGDIATSSPEGPFVELVENICFALGIEAKEGGVVGAIKKGLKRAKGDAGAVRRPPVVDADRDAAEALARAPIYLPPTEARFGRPAKPRSHWLYRSSGAVYAALADPADGSMLLELRADGRDGGAHISLIPPSVTSGEGREWCGEPGEPAAVDAAVLTRRGGSLPAPSSCGI